MPLGPPPPNLLAVDNNLIRRDDSQTHAPRPDIHDLHDDLVVSNTNDNLFTETMR
jgi:hypothetical protein